MAELGRICTWLRVPFYVVLGVVFLKLSTFNFVVLCAFCVLQGWLFLISLITLFPLRMLVTAMFYSENRWHYINLEGMVLTFAINQRRQTTPEG